jgi:hypothetical protein
VAGRGGGGAPATGETRQWHCRIGVARTQRSAAVSVREANAERGEAVATARGGVGHCERGAGCGVACWGVWALESPGIQCSLMRGEVLLFIAPGRGVFRVRL